MMPVTRPAPLGDKGRLNESAFEGYAIFLTAAVLLTW